jgi:hypothetical protein
MQQPPTPPAPLTPPTHWTEALDSLRGQLATQDAAWHGVERALGALDSETLVRIEQDWMSELDSAVDVTPVAVAAPLGAVRV